MNQQEKQLLIKDLCSRLPYGVKINHIIYNWVGTCINFNRKLESFAIEKDNGLCYDVPVEEVRPYLRPMSSMTEEELRDFAKIKFEDDAIWEIVEFPNMKCYKGFINVKCKNKNNGDAWIFQVNTRTPLETYYGIDWLNAHHFDYRGLIPMGLALEAKEGMYKQ